MNNLLQKLGQDFPKIDFISSNRFRWSPEDKIIYFAKNSGHSTWSLLHEVSHMVCDHLNYSSDLGLLRMEVEAWQKARELSIKYNCRISESYIEKCLDSYREWIYKRSSCPICTQAGLEKDTRNYQCINCGNRWKVSSERFCRVYRRQAFKEGKPA